MVRTRRWPSTATRVEEIRNGSTPISIRRVTAPGGVVGVEGAQDEVAGEGGLDGNLGGLQVAHFSDHDDVRVLAQKRAEGAAEGQADGFVDGHLHDAFDVIFDRVLGGEELGVNGVDPAQAGIEGGRLAAAGRAGDHDDAVGALDGLGDVIVEVLGEAQAPRVPGSPPSGPARATRPIRRTGWAESRRAGQRTRLPRE